jgi:hypothetical protein
MLRETSRKTGTPKACGSGFLERGPGPDVLTPGPIGRRKARIEKLYSKYIKRSALEVSRGDSFYADVPCRLSFSDADTCGSISFAGSATRRTVSFFPKDQHRTNSSHAFTHDPYAPVTLTDSPRPPPSQEDPSFPLLFPGQERTFHTFYESTENGNPNVPVSPRQPENISDPANASTPRRVDSQEARIHPQVVQLVPTPPRSPRPSPDATSIPRMVISRHLSHDPQNIRRDSTNNDATPEFHRIDVVAPRTFETRGEPTVQPGAPTVPIRLPHTSAPSSPQRQLGAVAGMENSKPLERRCITYAEGIHTNRRHRDVGGIKTSRRVQRQHPFARTCWSSWRIP